MVHDAQITTRATRGPDWHELRFSLEGGGPCGAETIVFCDREGVQISVWNPWRNEWATVNLKGHGEISRTEEQASDREASPRT